MNILSTIGRKTRVIIILSLFIWLVCPLPVSAAGFLLNGDAEVGDLSGWSVSGIQGAVVESQEESVGTVLPYSGSFFFTSASAPGSSVSFFQSGLAPLQPGNNLVLTGYVQTENLAGDDFGTATIRILNSENQVIANVSSPELTTGSLTWQKFTLELEVPEYSEGWEIELSGTLVYGTYINVFWDQLSLVEESISGVEDSSKRPKSIILKQNFPNPFNPSTTIEYFVPKIMNVQLGVFDLSGRHICSLRDGLVDGPAFYKDVWHGDDQTGRPVSAGIYIYRLKAGPTVEEMLMVLVK